MAFKGPDTINVGCLDPLGHQWPQQERFGFFQLYSYHIYCNDTASKTPDQPLAQQRLDLLSTACGIKSSYRALRPKVFLGLKKIHVNELRLKGSTRASEVHAYRSRSVMALACGPRKYGRTYDRAQRSHLFRQPLT